MKAVRNTGTEKTGADMKICITSKGDNIASEMDERFGRCGYFIFYDTVTKQIDVMKNIFAESGGGAGTKAAQLMAEKGVETLVTGHLGENASAGINAAGIKVKNETNKKVSEIISSFLEQK